MELDILQPILEWMKSNPKQCVGGGALILILLPFFSHQVRVNFGKAISTVLKRIPLIGGLVERKVEETVKDIAEGMAQDEIKPVDTAALKADIEKKYPAPQIEPENKG